MNMSGTPLTLALSAFVLLAGVSYASAQKMQPGLWRFTQNTKVGSQTASKAKTQCLTSKQADNPAAFFAPRGRGCVLVTNSAWVNRLTATARCTVRGATSQITSTVRVSSPTSISISTTMTATGEGGRTATVSLTGAGERIGECGGRRGRGRTLRRARS